MCYGEGKRLVVIQRANIMEGLLHSEAVRE